MNKYRNIILDYEMIGMANHITYNFKFLTKLKLQDARYIYTFVPTEIRRSDDGVTVILRGSRVNRLSRIPVGVSTSIVIKNIDDIFSRYIVKEFIEDETHVIGESSNEV